jgi:hypothetical protein
VSPRPGRRAGRTRLKLKHVAARRNAIAKLAVLERPPAVQIDCIFDVRVCFGCGCTDDFGCSPGCWWIDVDQCSSCADVPRELELPGHHLQRAAAENA